MKATTSHVGTGKCVPQSNKTYYVQVLLSYAMCSYHVCSNNFVLLELVTVCCYTVFQSTYVCVSFVTII